MKFEWSSAAVGMIAGIGLTLASAVAFQVEVLTYARLCAGDENGLTCSREWANAFAILAGAAVVAVTVAGQRQEAARHRETIRLTREPDIRRISKLSASVDELEALAARISEQRKRLEGFAPDEAEAQFATRFQPMYPLTLELRQWTESVAVSEARPLFDAAVETDFNKLLSSLGSAPMETFWADSGGAYVAYGPNTAKPIGPTGVDTSGRTRADFAQMWITSIDRIQNEVHAVIGGIRKQAASYRALWAF